MGFKLRWNSLLKEILHYKLGLEDKVLSLVLGRVTDITSMQTPSDFTMQEWLMTK